MILITGILLTADLFTVNKRYLNEDDFDRKKNIENPYTPSAADKIILADKSLDYRVLNLANPFNDGATSYFHKSIGGYHAAKLGRYQDLIDFRLQPEINQLIEALQNPNGTAINKELSALSSLNMLNTKYIIYNPQAAPIKNPFANGNAWFVKHIDVVENANEELSNLALVDTKNVALIDKRYKDQIEDLNIEYHSANSIELVDYKSNNLIYKANTSSEQLAVFSEIYYEKGWNAYIDGKLTPYLRADYTLRAMRIPAGEHTIEFRFLPKSYYLGEKIALVGSILLLISLLGIIAREFSFYLKERKTAA